MPAGKTKRWLQVGLSLALSGFFLYLALRGEDWGEISEGLSHARYEWIVAMLIAGVYMLYVRTQRWVLLLSEATGTPQPFKPVFSASAIGFMANMVLPLRAGEVLRPYLASRGTGVPMTTVLATAVVERVLDLLALVMFGFYVILNRDVPDTARQLTQIAAGIVTVLVIGLAVVILQRERMIPILDSIWRRLPGGAGDLIIRLEHEFLDGMAVVAKPSVLVRAVAWSLWIWLVIAGGFSFGFLATGVDVPLVDAGITATTIVALIVSVPGAPGFVGQFEYGCKLALDMYGVDSAKAVAFALVTHATQFVGQVGLGLVYLLREGLSFGELGRMGEPSED